MRSVRRRRNYLKNDSETAGDFRATAGGHGDAFVVGEFAAVVEGARTRATRELSESVDDRVSDLFFGAAVHLPGDANARLVPAQGDDRAALTFADDSVRFKVARSLSGLDLGGSFDDIDEIRNDVNARAFAGLHFGLHYRVRVINS